MPTSPRAEPSPPGRGEGGVALLEAILGLAIVTLAVSAALSAFVTAVRGSDAAADRLAALSLAESVLDEASLPASLAAALADAGLERQGAAGDLAWTLVARRYLPEAREADPPLVELGVEVTRRGAAGPLVALRTLRALP